MSLIMFVLAFLFHCYLEHQKVLTFIDESSAIELQMFPDTLKIDGNQMNFEGKLLETNEKVLVTYQLESETEKELYSQMKKTVKLRVYGVTQEVTGIRNLNGFDYERYLDITGISQKIKVNQIETVETIETDFFHPITKLRELRRRALVFTNNRFEPLTASFMNALLFGFKENGPDSFQTTWQNLGEAHLFSLSGMHIYFFIFVFEIILLSLGITKENLFRVSLFLIFSLMIITGAGPGMMRAGMQWLIKKINQRFKWELSALDCWSLALFINCLFDPYVLLTVGGQLTYYLTFLIVFIQPMMGKIDGELVKGWVFNLLLSWLSLPLIWFHFYEWNVLNFLLSIILGPILFIFILPMLLICFTLALLFQHLTFHWFEKILVLFQRVGEDLATRQLFKYVTGKLPLILLLIVFILQVIWLIDWEKSGELVTKKGVLLVALTFVISFWKFADPRGMIAFIDVGQGDSIFVQLPFNRGNYLIDTGGRLNFEEEAWQQSLDKRGADYTVIPFLKSQGVKHLNTAFITHAHEDHFGDLDRISDHVLVDSVVFGPGSYEQTNFRNMLNYTHLKHSRKYRITNENKWQKGNVTLDCFYPFETGDGQNNDSLVLKLRIKDQSILLMGDLELEGENELLADESLDLKADILKVGHHGSKTSSQKSFIDRVKPKISVISCGVNNRYQHPSQETLDTLSEVKTDIYRTDQDGMVYLRWSFLKPSFSSPQIVKNNSANNR